MADPSPTLTERKKQRTWEDLVEVANALFLTRGFDETTIEAIAAAAEVSPRTVHRYFPTKEDLFLAKGQISWTTFLGALRDRPAAEPVVQAVSRASREAFGEAWADGPRVLTFMNVLQQAPLLDARWRQQGVAFQADLAEVLAGRAGRRRPDLTDHVAAAAVISTIAAGMRVWADSASHRPLLPVIERALAVLSGPVLPA